MCVCVSSCVYMFASLCVCVWAVCKITCLALHPQDQWQSSLSKVMQWAGEFFNISPMVLGGCLDKYRCVDACLSLAYSLAQPPKLLIKSNLEEGSGKREKKFGICQDLLCSSLLILLLKESAGWFSVCGGGWWIALLMFACSTARPSMLFPTVPANLPTVTTVNAFALWACDYVPRSTQFQVSTSCFNNTHLLSANISTLYALFVFTFIPASTTVSFLSHFFSVHTSSCLHYSL